MGKELKRFTSLERLVLKKLVNLIDSESYDEIIADDNDLRKEYPLRMVTESKRHLKTLGELDIQTLVYLITSDKADLMLRVNALKVAFHKINNSEEYPYSNLITKEEFVNEAFLPEVRSILLALKLNLEGDEDEKKGDKCIGEEPRKTTTDEDKDEVEEHRRSDRETTKRVIPKPNIF